MYGDDIHDDPRLIDGCIWGPDLRDAMMTGCRRCGMPTEDGSNWCPDCWWGK